VLRPHRPRGGQPPRGPGQRLTLPAPRGGQVLAGAGGGDPAERGGPARLAPRAVEEGRSLGGREPGPGERAASGRRVGPAIEAVLLLQSFRSATAASGRHIFLAPAPSVEPSQGDTIVSSRADRRNLPRTVRRPRRQDEG